MAGIKGINKGIANGMWKGNKVGYAALHEWVTNHLPKPKTCTCCRLKRRLELANISGKYKRNLLDWEWLCRKCHMRKDGRLKRLIRRNKDNSTGRYSRCKICGSKHWVKSCIWDQGWGRFCSKDCYGKWRILNARR